MRKSSMNKSGSTSQCLFWAHKRGMILWCQPWIIDYFCILGRLAWFMEFMALLPWYTSFHMHRHSIRKQLKCHDMISVCHNHHSTTRIGWWFNLVINPRNGGFRWLDAFLAWYTVSQSPGDCRGHKNATKKRVVESDDPMEDPRN